MDEDGDLKMFLRHCNTPIKQHVHIPECWNVEERWLGPICIYAMMEFPDGSELVVPTVT